MCLRAAAIVVTASVLILSACSANASRSERPRHTGSSYVAIGDSYTAGPGIPQHRESSGPCWRSTHNYPTLLAHKMGIDNLRDVSCSGATTSDVLHGHDPINRQYDPINPQVDALSGQTKLVTVGIGGNDDELFATMLAGCALVSQRDAKGSPCHNVTSDTIPPRLEKAEKGVHQVLSAVHRRAPRARVVLVGYPQITPPSGHCRNLPYAYGDYPWLRHVEDELDQRMKSAAESTDTEYVSMRKPSHGHDACAGDRAWVNGRVHHSGQGHGFHPRPAGMRAVASRLKDHLTG